MPSPVDAVIAALGLDPSRPRFTGYTELGRTELSGTVLLNWASKVAGLLIDEVGLGPGNPVSVRSPAHWQTAGIVLGALWAGLAVTDGQADVAFVPPGEDADADEVFVVSGHPLGLPVPRGQLGTHQRDYSTAARIQADRFTPRFSFAGVVLGSGSGGLAADELRAAVAAGDFSAGQRVLTAGVWDFDGTRPGVVSHLLAPLRAGAAVIHCLDDVAPEALAHRAEVERADATIGLEVPGLPRLG
jgi:uncharacterized protein (TIGR03089 family)